MTPQDRQQLEESLSAYLDGELSGDELRNVEQTLASDESAQRMLAELEQTAGAVAALPRHEAPPGILDDLLRHTERDALLGGDAELWEAPTSSGRSWLAGLSMAAVLGIAVVGGVWIVGGGFSPEPERVAMLDSVDDSLPVPESSPASQHDIAFRGVPSKESEAKTESFDDLAAAPGPKIEDAVAMLPIEEKLRQNVALSAIRDHSFGNEDLKLEIELGSDAEAESATNSLISKLSASNFANLESVSGEPETQLNRQVFLPGRPDVNFAGTQSRQILVRVPARQAEQLIETVQRAGVPENQLALQAGPLSFRGASQAREVLRRQAVALADDAGRADSTQKDPDAFLEDLYRALGLEEVMEGVERAAEPERLADASIKKDSFRQPGDARTSESRQVGASEPQSEQTADAPSIPNERVAAANRSVVFKQEIADETGAAPGPTASIPSAAPSRRSRTTKPQSDGDAATFESGAKGKESVAAKQAQPGETDTATVAALSEADTAAPEQFITIVIELNVNPKLAKPERPRPTRRANPTTEPRSNGKGELPSQG